MRLTRMLARSSWALMILAAPGFVGAQQSLAPIAASGRTVTPAFEGWYRNPDGSFSISFGYFNRNAEEVLEIPVGPDNFIQPGAQNQGQPTTFHPRRHWGVFAVSVPADFGEKKVTWTVRIRGETYAISGSLSPDWQIDALEGEAGSDNTPPWIKLEEKGIEGRGPAGITGGPIAAVTGQPVTLNAWVRDDGKGAAATTVAGRGGGAPVTITWLKHQGPGAVTFAPPTNRVPSSGGVATTSATFGSPGEYIVRLRANDASGVANAGHAQCCWTNAFLKVTVTQSSGRGTP